jgi:uncharacterized protein YdaU (DUF1376 family)
MSTYEDLSLEEQVVLEICAEAALNYKPTTLLTNVGEHLARTSHLTLEENGALLRLRMVMEIDADRGFLDQPEVVARVLRCSKHRWLNKLAPVVMPLLNDGVGDMS